ncbi:hypothetical protein AB0N93_16505 [Streptomyces sp. NPDC091267]|uniref:hypothetical protein n=1 Tax=Streptomyces sp. NPDC091267 TaxID=3155195 RepID=UPI0034455BC4
MTAEQEWLEWTITRERVGGLDRVIAVGCGMKPSKSRAHVRESDRDHGHHDRGRLLCRLLSFAESRTLSVLRMEDGWHDKGGHMGLNSRRAQIFWAIVPIALAGFILELPFIWRALKTKKRSDIRAAAVFGIAQLAVYAAFAFDQSNKADEISDITGSVVWLCAFSAAVGAAYLYRPLNKEEIVDQRRDTRPGSSYLR